MDVLKNILGNATHVPRRDGSLYRDRVFEIELADFAFSSEGELTGRGARAFAHEYVHLYQQLATGYGAREVWSLFHEAAFVEESIRAENVPRTDRWSAERDDRILRKKDSANAASAFAIESVTTVPEIENDGSVIRIPFIQGVDPAGVSHEIRLGAPSILEAQSTAVDWILGVGPPIGETPYTYHIVRELMEACWSVDQYHVLTVCQFALLFAHPAATFYQVLLKLQERFGSRLPDAGIVYNYLRSVLPVRKQVGRILGGYRYFMRYYSARGPFEPRGIVARWAGVRAHQLLPLMLDRTQYFPLELFGFGRAFRVDWNRLISLLPYPMLSARNARNDSLDVAGREACNWMRCYAHITDRLSGQPVEGCPIRLRCSAADKNDDCFDEPWSRLATHPPCHYTNACRSLGISERHTHLFSTTTQRRD